MTVTLDSIDSDTKVLRGLRAVASGGSEWF